MIFSRDPHSMHEFNEILLGLNIGIVAAQHLEGGPEAQLHIKAGKAEHLFVGSYETGFNENDENLVQWEIPVVMGLRPVSR